MENKLQKIKDEVAEEFGYKSNSVFNAYEQLLINPHGFTYKILDDSVNQVAIRYAQEQKRELVEVLKECIDWEYMSVYNESLYARIEELIAKHEQTERRSE